MTTAAPRAAARKNLKKARKFWRATSTRRRARSGAQHRSRTTRIRGDRFRARPRPNVREGDKPTEAQKRARARTIKARTARRKR